MTRTECEEKIVAKLDEIAEIAREFDPRCHHLSMYIIGGSASVYCSDEETEEPILDMHRSDDDEEEGGEW